MGIREVPEKLLSSVDISKCELCSVVFPDSALAKFTLWSRRKSYVGLAALGICAPPSAYRLLEERSSRIKHAMSVSSIIVLPGDEIPRDALPKAQNEKKALKLGPGLRHIPPNTITTTIAGALVTDSKKNAAYIEYNSGRVSCRKYRLNALF